jgi:hypothetical protein
MESARGTVVSDIRGRPGTGRVSGLPGRARRDDDRGRDAASSALSPDLRRELIPLEAGYRQCMCNLRVAMALHATSGGWGTTSRIRWARAIGAS